MKKLICATLALLFTLSFAGCKKVDTSTDDSENKTTSNYTIDENGNVVFNESSDDTNDSSDDTSTTTDDKHGENLTDYELTGTVILNDKDITVSVDDVADSYLNGNVIINLHISNNSNKDLYFQTRNFKINGVDISGTLLSKMVDSKCGFDTFIAIEKSDLEAYGITGVSDYSFNLFIFTVDPYEEYLYSDTITLETGKEGSFKIPDGETVYESDDILIVLLPDDETITDTKVLYVENKTDSDMNLSVKSNHGIEDEEEAYQASLFCRLSANGRTSSELRLMITDPDVDGEKKVTIPVIFEVFANGKTIELPEIEFTFYD